MSLGGNSWMILASASNPLTQQPETFVAYVCFRLSIRRWGTLASHELEVASQSHEVNIRSTDNVEALISVTLSYAIGGISVRLSVRHTHTHGGIDSRLNMQFLPHDAMHSADYDIARCLCLSACLPHAGILSKRFYYQTFLLSDRHTILVFCSTKHYGNISTETTLTEAPNAGGTKNLDFRPISGYISEKIQDRL